ncbi:LysR substrate-binding domain-containing protein [Sphingosinicella sp.]|jgi:DNA-binding transcriptional LysR family regulator|uniref:LysR substrate-binding domain-containing protein n=1 Tax=Sphingosinicella sp. TaxID=1917971 RepID=UPI0035B4072A
MDLRQLRYFVTLCEELHFRRAAEKLNITQAPLSVAIKSLETELGAQLFHRTQRRVSLTQVGAAFRQQAAAVLDQLDRSIEEIREMVSGEAGQLRIGFTTASSLLVFFPQIIRAFRTRYPKVDIRLHDLSSQQQIAALENRDIDVGLLRSPQIPVRSDIHFVQILQDPLIVAMHADSPLLAREKLHIADLRGEPMIFYPRNSGVGIHEQFLRLCGEAGFVPNIVQEVRESATIISLAASGLGVAVVPSELQCINVPNIRFKPLADEGAMTYLVMASRAGEASTLVANLRRMVQASIARSTTPVDCVFPSIDVQD